MHLKTAIRMIVSIIIVFIVDTIPHIVSTNLKVNFPGVSETKIISGKEMDFNPSIPGYVFEYVPTPLAFGGVGLYINDSLKYTVIEKVSDEASQSLWIEIQLRRKVTSFVVSYIDNITLPNVSKNILMINLKD